MKKLGTGIAGVFAGVGLAIAYFRIRQSPGPDVRVTSETSTGESIGAPKQLTVRLPAKTKNSLRAKGLSENALNGNVRETPWGKLLTGLPEGSIVDVLASVTAPEPGGLKPKTWYQIRTADGATTGWMHEDILR